MLTAQLGEKGRAGLKLRGGEDKDGYGFPGSRVAGPTHREMVGGDLAEARDGDGLPLFEHVVGDDYDGVGRDGAVGRSPERRMLFEQDRKLPHRSGPINWPLPAHPDIPDGQKKQLGYRLVTRESDPSLHEVAQ